MNFLRTIVLHVKSCSVRSLST